MAPAHEVMAEATQAGRKLREAIPEVYAAYAAMQAATTGAEDGALSPKVRELIALAIAVSMQCDGCIAAHARRVAQHDATSIDEEDQAAQRQGKGHEVPVAFCSAGTDTTRVLLLEGHVHLCPIPPSERRICQRHAASARRERCRAVVQRSPAARQEKPTEPA